VGEAVMQMDQATQQNAALVEQSAAAAESLKNQAQQLVEAVSAFRISGSSTPSYAVPSATAVHEVVQVKHASASTALSTARTHKPASKAHSSAAKGTSATSPVERRSPDRAKNVVRPAFGAGPVPKASAEATSSSAPATVFESNLKTGSDDWETF
jgi:methyl-accepting chemotaxis protein